MTRGRLIVLCPIPTRASRLPARSYGQRRHRTTGKSGAGRRGALALACLSLLALFGLFSAPSASGALTHPFLSEFTGSDTPGGSLGTGTSADKLGVDQSTGNVWVIDKQHAVLDKFDASGSYISQIAFGRGRLLAVGSWDSTVTLWDVAKRRSLVKLTGHTRGISTLAFNPSGTMLATGSADNTVRIWDPTSGRTLRILDLPTYVYAVDFAEDGRLYTMDNTGVVSIWDPCPGCNDGDALLAASDKRVTRKLTALERETFLGGF